MWTPPITALTSPARRPCRIISRKTPIPDGVHLMSAPQFQAMCQGLGIGDDTLVVCYDNSQSLYAARLWWALHTYGHRSVKVLNGGWRGWLAGGNPVGLERAAPAQGVVFTPRRDESLLVMADELMAACRLEDAVIWDVRSDGEWDGSQSRGNKRVGHIPGAVHLEWFNVMDRQTHRFRARRRNPAAIGGTRHYPRQERVYLLTGRHPCGARRVCAATGGLRADQKL